MKSNSRVPTIGVVIFLPSVTEGTMHLHCFSKIDGYVISKL